MPAIIPKGVVGGFEFTVFQRNLKEWRERLERMFASKRESNKSRFDSYSQEQYILLSNIPIILFGIVACTFFPTTFSK